MDKVKSPSKMTLSITQVAEMLGISRNSAYQGVMTGEIPSIRIGKRILVPIKALERMLEGAGQKAEEQN
jgi:excisionase family DNA binding protein